MKCKIEILNDCLKVVVAYSPIVVERFRAVPGAKPHFDQGKFQFWTFPIMPDTVLMVTDICGVLPWMLEPDVRKVIEEHTKKPDARPAADLSLINGHSFKTTPYDHQRANLARTIAERRWLFADEQGTGKSMPLCNRIKMLLDAGDAKILIICPRSVIPGWRDQLREHAGLECVLVTGSKGQKAKRLAERCAIKVASYETILAAQDDFAAIAWDAIVCDEIQKIKNFTAKSSKVIQDLSTRVKYFWGLSGTPFPNGLEDCLGVIAAVKPGHLKATTKTAFDARYTFKARVGEDGPFKIAGYRNVDELHGYIAAITSRVTKAEALDLPPKVISARYAELEGEQARVYRELKKDAVATIKSLKASGELTVRNILTEQLRLLQVVGGFVPDDSGVVHELPVKCKLSAIRDVIDEVGDKQVVLWAAFVAEVDFLAKWLEQEYGGKSVVLTGGVGDADRKTNVEAFTRGDARWFVGTAGAGGVGINGLQVCDTEIYYSRNFRMDFWKQSQDRCHRIGSKADKVSIIKLICENTVDVRVDDRLEEKDAMQEMMLTNPEELF